VKTIQEAWSADTSMADDWTPENPAKGQCAVTALVVQDLLGGKLLRAVVEGESHYFNQLPDGSWLDLTWSQFPEGAGIDALPQERTRDYVLSFEHTRTRYARLLRAVVLGDS
jgi:hypothetical protein